MSDALTDHQGRRFVAWCFVLAEFASLARAIGAEWVVKLTTDPAVRFRAVPDCRMMRPVRVTRDEWAAGLEWVC